MGCVQQKDITKPTVPLKNKQFTITNTLIPSNKPDYYLDILDAGNRQMDRRDFDSAIRQFEKALKIDSSDDSLLNCLSICHHVKKKYDIALDYALKSYSIKETSFNCNSLGNIYEKLKDDTEAFKFKKKQVELNQNSPRANQALGAFYLYHKKDKPNAIRLFKRSVQLDKNYIQGHQMLGFALQLSDRWTQALNQYSIALQLDPEDQNTKQAINRVKKYMQTS